MCLLFGPWTREDWPCSHQPILVVLRPPQKGFHGSDKYWRWLTLISCKTTERHFSYRVCNSTKDLIISMIKFLDSLCHNQNLCGMEFLDPMFFSWTKPKAFYAKQPFWGYEPAGLGQIRCNWPSRGLCTWTICRIWPVGERHGRNAVFGILNFGETDWSR